MLFVLLFTALFFILWGVFYAVTPLLMRGLGILAHKTAAFRYNDYVPVALLLIAALFVAVVSGDAFVDLAEMVHENSPTLRDVDATAHHWAAGERSLGATRFFTIVTIIGTPVGLAVLMLPIAVMLAVKGRYRWLAYLLFTTGVGALLVVQLKVYFARARPDLAAALRSAHGYSFPSGHAMGSMVVCGALAYLGYRALPTLRLKSAAIALAATFVASVAASRVYLGVHWISDVVAGLSGGLLWVIGTTISYETFRRIRLIRALRAKRQTDPQT
jgi:undecaprenyl-diphosphatase